MEDDDHDDDEDCDEASEKGRVYDQTGIVE